MLLFVNYLRQWNYIFFEFTIRMHLISKDMNGILDMIGLNRMIKYIQTHLCNKSYSNKTSIVLKKQINLNQILLRLPNRKQWRHKKLLNHRRWLRHKYYSRGSNRQNKNQLNHLKHNQNRRVHHLNKLNNNSNKQLND